MGYTATPGPVSASWQSHKDRTPPSSEPGTDIACPYGTPIPAAGDGVVYEVKTSTSGAMGRVVGVRLDDGRDQRKLHCSAIWVTVGQSVNEGQILGESGASGYGSDWYYGPHVHDTLWPGAAWSDPTIDFWLYVGPDTPGPTPGPNPEEDNMLYLLQVDPASDGRWFLADFGAGTAQRIYNGLQLDLIKRDPNVNQVFGGQPLDVLAGLTIGGQ